MARKFDQGMRHQPRRVSGAAEADDEIHPFLDRIDEAIGEAQGELKARMGTQARLQVIKPDRAEICNCSKLP